MTLFCSRCKLPLTSHSFAIIQNKRSPILACSRDASDSGRNALFSAIRAAPALRKADTSTNADSRAKDPRSELLDAIRGGKKLRKAEVNADKRPKDARSELLEAIRGGKALRKVGPSDALGPLRMAAELDPHGDLMSAIRNGNLHPSSTTGVVKHAVGRRPGRGQGGTPC